MAEPHATFGLADVESSAALAAKNQISMRSRPAPLRHGPNGAPAAALVVLLADTDGAYDPLNLMRLLASAEINMPWLAKGGYPVLLFHRDSMPLGE